MQKKEIYFISGLPKSGSTLISNILKQNSQIYTEPTSFLSDIIGSINYSWNDFESKNGNMNKESKIGFLSGALKGYYQHINQPFIIDSNYQWISQINLLETILQKKVKMVVCVRNPADILTSFEKIKKENPLYVMDSDKSLLNNTSIAARAYYYSSPQGILGKSHEMIKDAIVMGYLDRLLFVDYNRFCNTPKNQTKRIYDFLEIENFEHDFNHIEQKIYNNISSDSMSLHNIRPNLQKTTVNCVQYLGLNLYEQYNSQIFWNAWI